MIRCFTVDGPWVIGKKASAGLDWWLVFRVISPLPLSLPLRCCHMPVWYQHMVGNTLLSMCLFICVPVYPSFLSLRASSSLSLSLNPLLPQSICCQKHPEYLSASLFAFLSSCSTKRKGAGQLTFHAPQCTQAHIQKGIWYLSPAFLQLMKDVKKN